jgi:hypothetical protein
MMDDDFRGPHLDPPELNDIGGVAPELIHILGNVYELSSYSEPYSDGSRHAILRLVVPF